MVAASRVAEDRAAFHSEVTVDIEDKSKGREVTITPKGSHIRGERYVGHRIIGSPLEEAGTLVPNGAGRPPSSIQHKLFGRPDECLNDNPGPPTLRRLLGYSDECLEKFLDSKSDEIKVNIDETGMELLRGRSNLRRLRRTTAILIENHEIHTLDSFGVSD